MSQRSRKVDAQIYLERVTIHDKKSMFRPSNPPVYILSIVAEVGNRKLILREENYGTKELQTNRYNELRNYFNMETK